MAQSGDGPMFNPRAFRTKFYEHMILDSRGPRSRETSLRASRFPRSDRAPLSHGVPCRSFRTTRYILTASFFQCGESAVTIFDWEVHGKFENEPS